MKTICWENNCIKLIDQTKLPLKLEYITCRDVKTLWWAIKRLSVRGAPAIGVAAAFGVILGLKSFKGENRKDFIRKLNKICDYIGSSRPTAVNLFNALEQMKEDEGHHATVALDAGAADLPSAIKKFMSLTSKIMTKAVYRI